MAYLGYWVSHAPDMNIHSLTIDSLVKAFSLHELYFIDCELLAGSHFFMLSRVLCTWIIITILLG